MRGLLDCISWGGQGLPEAIRQLRLLESCRISGPLDLARRGEASDRRTEADREQRVIRAPASRTKPAARPLYDCRCWGKPSV